MAVDSIPVKMDARRVCDAIARIGYSPSSALMDIIDNSVTAGATSVVVEIATDPDKNFGDRSNVLSYRIVAAACVVVRLGTGPGIAAGGTQRWIWLGGAWRLL